MAKLCIPMVMGVIVGLHLTAMLGLNPAHRQICVRNIVQFNLSKKSGKRERKKIWCQSSPFSFDKGIQINEKFLTGHRFEHLDTDRQWRRRRIPD